MKVVTICGSMKFEKEMIDIAYMLEAKNGYCVIQCVYCNVEEPTQEEMKNLSDCHYKKIDISDAIYVVDINGYIGKSTQNEINYANSKGKEIIYHSKCQ